ncbi:amidohydrolase family protein [Jatrophihabitans telluris]|uniref:Amidohydrolase family protein n=1 Tax=Jatrophihabitans telluris TaxID=2038343 RepID=A0ABY4QWS6_9ACTN|nr:amidohydrolase family protein [Jatrophihabitans telluris]UQX87399.1 amidohydrolase family protein [Jatrophihabitans telluris]
MVITGGQIFDGTSAPAFPGEVVIEGDRIVEVRRGHHPDRHEGHEVLDVPGRTVMPGMIESHSHLTFPSAVGHIDPSFNPPLDVSFFHHIEGFPSELARAERNAKIVLDAGFTSAYSAGSIIEMPVEPVLRDKLRAGVIPGPRFLAAAAERDNHPQRPDGHFVADWQGPESSAAWVHEKAAQGFDSIKFLVSNDDVFTPGGSMITQYSAEELNAAGQAAREENVWLNGHCQSPESVKLAVRAGFRSIYHCTYADAEALDLLEAHKDSVFVSPAPGIIYANVYEGEEFGITREVAESMGSVAALAGMQEIYPEIRKRGIRALIGGDYGFPNNPIGRNARDLQLFVEQLGYSPVDALVAATQYGGQLMGMGDELGLVKAGYLADLLVIDGDPTADVTVLQDADKITHIMQGGSFYKAPATVGA